jgi:pyruvate/2-oxoglutarate dehydrogenase complex dihydrolipoamide dehydrogenase (E3) component
MDVRGFVKVNETMRTNVADVYAIGDACAFPLPWYTGNDTPVNIQHYQMAEKHGEKK